MRNNVELDATDQAILLLLRADGRLTNLELARQVGLTPAPCLRRVRRLEDEGVIRGYRAVVDPVVDGRDFEIWVSVVLQQFTQDNIEQFETAIGGFDEVRAARRLYGSTDYLLRVCVADQAAYEHFHTHKLSPLTAVARVISQPTMKMIKDD